MESNETYCTCCHGRGLDSHDRICKHCHGTGYEPRYFDADPVRIYPSKTTNQHQAI